MADDPGYLNETIRRWKRDARVFVRECIGVTPDAWQDEALELVSDPSTRRLAFKACKGPGKTAVLAWIILWFLTTHVQSKVGATSITEGNIDTNLWPELSKWMTRSAFLSRAFFWTTSRVQRRGELGKNWFATKRTWPKSGDAQQQADALAGIHADDVMFVLDESGGIPQAVMVTAEAVLANAVKPGHRGGVVVQSGNPTHTTGPLYRACSQDRALWKLITITGDPDSPKRSPRIDPVWAREQIASYGRENPWVMINVLGEFPPSSINALLGVEEVERAMHRHLRVDQYDFAQKRIGVDVARFGDDRTVIFPRQGLASFMPIIMRVQRTTAIAAQVARSHMLWSRGSSDDVLILIDDTGHWGHGAVDALVTAGKPVVPVMANEKSPNKRYRTLRDEMWFELATWVKGGGALPPIPELVAELTEPTYTFLGGQILVEPKDQVKARLGHSPDLGDGLAQTFALPDVPAGILEKLRGRQTTLHDQDPYVRAVEEGGVGRVEMDFNPFETR